MDLNSDSETEEYHAHSTTQTNNQHATYGTSASNVATTSHGAQHAEPTSSGRGKGGKGLGKGGAKRHRKIVRDNVAGVRLQQRCPRVVCWRGSTGPQRTRRGAVPQRSPSLPSADWRGAVVSSASAA